MAGVTALFIGLVQAALFWAVATIGDHIIRGRSLLEPSQANGTVTSTTESTSRGAAYQLVITNVGPRPDRVAKALRASFDLDEGEAKQALGGAMPLIGGYATVEGARMAVQAAGGQAQTAGPE